MRTQLTHPVLHNLQALRGMAVLLVLLVHLQASEQHHSPDQLLPALCRFGVMGVDIFFVISGFIMVTVTSDHAQSLTSLWRFLQHRLTRIYPAYWLVSCALLFATGWVDSTSITPSLNTDFIIRSLLLLPQAQMPLLSVGWTLVHELFFYAVFTVLLLLPLRWRMTALLLWGGVTVAAYMHWHPPVWQPWRVLLTSPLTLEFIAGCLLAIALRRWRLPRPDWVLLTGVVVTLASWYGWMQWGNDAVPGEMSRVLLFLPPCALLLAGAVSMEQQSARLLPHWLTQLGDASYSIYLTHVPAIATFSLLWREWNMGSNTLMDNVVVVSTTVMTTLTVGMLFSRWIEKPLLLQCRRWQ